MCQWNANTGSEAKVARVCICTCVRVCACRNSRLWVKQRARSLLFFKKKRRTHLDKMQVSQCNHATSLLRQQPQIQAVLQHLPKEKYRRHQSEKRRHQSEKRTQSLTTGKKGKAPQNKQVIHWIQLKTVSKKAIARSVWLHGSTEAWKHGSMESTVRTSAMVYNNRQSWIFFGYLTNVGQNVF